jgi:hypothetical protein
MMKLLRTLRRCYARPFPSVGRRPALEQLEVRALLTVMQPLSLAASPLDGPGGVLGGVPGYTPHQIRQVYGIDRFNFGAGPIAADGSGETIAIVTAYHNPTLAPDLAAFSTQFNLAAPNLTVVAQDGGNQLPAPDAAWAQETALDVQWAHAIAPAANLLVVEANNGDEANLYTAVDYAAAQPNVHVVSMSFGGPEDASETNADKHFQTPANHDGITFVAAAGDSGTVTYPAASPYVVGVGGTTLTLDAAGKRVSETAWGNGGGGVSQFEPVPAFQQGVLPANQKNRGTPDVAYNADPATGFAVYDSFGNPDQPWVSVGGTSAGAPQWSALLAIANQGRRLSGKGSLDGATQVLPLLYQSKASLYDVTQGGNGHFQAGPGYDLASGLGTPDAGQILVGLMGTTSTPPPPSTPPNTPPPSTGDGGLSAGPPFTVVTPNLGGIAGRPLDGVLAIVTVPSITAADLTVAIDWGNGQSSPGSVVSLGNDQYAIEGLIDYSQVGSDSIALTITDTAGGGNQSVTLQTVVTVQSASPGPSTGNPAGNSGSTAVAAAVVSSPVPVVIVEPFLPASVPGRHSQAHPTARKHHPAAHPHPAPVHHHSAHH